MLKINFNKVKKYYKDRLVLDIEDLKIFEADRVGVVGKNGSGKSTFLNLIENREEVDSGNIHITGSTSYMSQLEGVGGKISSKNASKMKILSVWKDSMSGGEKTKFKLVKAMEEKADILLLDEPTNNLDIESIDEVLGYLKNYRGTMVLVSHDRNFLNQTCDKILEIEDGRARLYSGNYTAYKEQKEDELKRARFEYDEYIREKGRLAKAASKVWDKSDQTRSTPKRMGNSEARLHKMGNQVSKKHLDNASKSLKTRIEKLERKDKPKDERTMKLDIVEGSQVYSKTLVTGNNINIGYNDKKIFEGARFTLENKKKLGLVGPNGSGKTSLIQEIVNEGSGIKQNKKVKIGYFTQNLDILDGEKTILENVLEGSKYLEEDVRMFLGRLLFRGDEVNKLTRVLSGGEKVKVSLAKVLLQDSNLLILDEPTNYLDLNSIEVLEETLIESDRPLLLVSHDREFLNNVVEEIIYIEDFKIKKYMGKYEEFLNRSKNNPKDNSYNDIMILENRLNTVIGQISMSDNEDERKFLDKEYNRILQSLKEIKKN